MQLVASITKTVVHLLGGAAPTSGWSIWTGVLKPANPFEISCGECESEVDCNFHGRCINKRCECENDWGGRSCQTCTGCSMLSRAKVISEKNEGGGSDNIHSSSGSDDMYIYTRLDGIEAYERPIYYHYNAFDSLTPEYTRTGSMELLFYHGTRFYVVAWEGFGINPEVGVQDSDLAKLREYFASFHASWHLDDNKNRTFIFYTDTTTAPMPLEVTWNKDVPVSTYVSFRTARVEGLKFDCSDYIERVCAFTIFYNVAGF